MTVLLNSYATSKRKQQLSSSNESDPAQAVGSSQPAAEGGLEMQVIVIPGFPEPGATDQTKRARVARTESKEADPVPSALQVIHPFDEGRPGRSKFMRSGMPKPPLPERIITNSYAPPRGLEPPRVKVSAPGADEVKFIMRRWEAFHHGEAVANRMKNLYPHMLWMPIAAQGMGLAKDYSVSVPAGTQKEDIEWIIDDGIQVCNRNYVQLTELVR